MSHAHLHLKLGPSKRHPIVLILAVLNIFLYDSSFQLEEDLEESDDDLPGDQEAAQFGWFNDLYILDTSE